MEITGFTDRPHLDTLTLGVLPRVQAKVKDFCVEHWEEIIDCMGGPDLSLLLGNLTLEHLLRLKPKCTEPYMEITGCTDMPHLSLLLDTSAARVAQQRPRVRAWM